MDFKTITHQQPNDRVYTNPQSVTTSNPDLDGAVELTIIHIAEERLRQARYSFNLAFVMLAASATIGFVGIGLLLSKKAPEGTITAAGGLASSVRCLQLAKEANDRLDKIAAELRNED